MEREETKPFFGKAPIELLKEENEVLRESLRFYEGTNWFADAASNILKGVCMICGTIFVVSFVIRSILYMWLGQ